MIGPADAKLLTSHVIDYILGKGTIAPRVEGRAIVARSKPPQ